MINMMNQKTIVFIFILAIAAGLLLGLRLFLIQKETALKVGLVFPENLATDISVSTQVKIDFNRPLETENEVNTTISPQISFIKTLKNNGQTLILTPQGPFSSGTEYSLTISDSQKRSLWQSKFTTEKLQGDPRIPYESEQYTRQNYPLLEFVPYETEGFSVTYTGPLALSVTIRKDSRQAVESLVLEWIKSHGVDPQTHQVKYLTPGL